MNWEEIFTSNNPAGGRMINVISGVAGSEASPYTADNPSGGRAINVNLIGGGSVATGVLQIQGGVPLDTTLRPVTDGMGTVSPLQLSTTQASITGSLSAPFFFVRNAADGSELFRLHADFATNLFIGNVAGENNTPLSSTQGRQNTFLGAGAGFSNTTGYATLNVGYAAGYSNTTGITNTNVGYQSGFNNITGGGNVNVGTDAGGGNLSSYNIFIGFHTGGNIGTPVISGANNTVVGTECATTGGTMANNSIYGYRSAFNITNGYANTFNGYLSGFNVTTGYQNVLIGGEAGFSLTTGYQNVYIGNRAGFYTDTSSYLNSGVGSFSLFNNTTGILNAAYGYNSGFRITTGQRNVMFGANTGVNVLQKVDAYKSVAIGYDSYTTKDYQVVLGDIDIGETLLFGSIGVNCTPVASAKVQIDSITQGFLPPRMTTAQRTAIASPATGLMVYDTDLNLVYVWNSAAWLAL